MTKLAQISNTIVADIESGALREGDQLPSEEKLAAAGNVVRLVFGAGGRGKTGSGGDQVGDRRDPSDPSDQRPARNPAQLQ